MKPGEDWDYACVTAPAAKLSTQGSKSGERDAKRSKGKTVADWWKTTIEFQGKEQTRADAYHSTLTTALDSSGFR